MNHPPFRFLVFSLAFHLAALGLLSMRFGSFLDAAPLRSSSRTAEHPLLVSLAGQANPKRGASDGRTPGGYGRMPAAAPRPVPGKDNEPPAKTTLLPDDIEFHDEFIPAGHLTRLPAPLNDIDLSAAALNPMDFIGEASMILLIDTDGRVVDVLSSVDSRAAEEFASRVAERFRQARFSPGEVEGRPVRSRLGVVVVSEGLLPTPANAAIESISR